MALTPITAIAAQSAGAAEALGGAAAIAAPMASPPGGSTATAAATATDFGAALTRAIDGVEASTDRADGMAVQAATGDLTDVHDAMIASTEASLATELTMAVRNKGLDAFNEIMRMPL